MHWDDDDDNELPAFLRLDGGGGGAPARSNAAASPAVNVPQQQQPPIQERQRQQGAKTGQRRQGKEPIFSGIPDEIVENLSTFDKSARSQASKDKRMAVLTSRVKRSKEKIAAAAENAVDFATATVDDSLMADSIGQTARDYERHVAYKNSTRNVTQHDDAKGKEEEEEKGKEEEEGCDCGMHLCHICRPSGELSDSDLDDDNDDGANDPMDIDEDAFYMNDKANGDEQEEVYIPRTLVVPGMALPDMAPQRRISTFSEYVHLDPAAQQFQSNMRNVKGPEQNHFVEVRKEEAIYGNVTNTLSQPLKNQQIMRYAIKRGMQLPDLPIVSKALIQDGLCSPDYDIGERPCVYGKQCTSYAMCLALKRDNSERYMGVDPFVCKEFYFGVKGERMREAIADGTPLSEIQNPEPVMCVMCHLSIVTKFYKEFDLDLDTIAEGTPLHILHSFQVIANVPGEYPVDKCLMGDDRFKGIIAPFLRYCPDNYVWNPIPPSVVTETDPVTMLQRRVVKAWQQRWMEVPGMDFH